MSGIIDIIRAETGGKAEALQLIREKAGVHVYRCVYEGQRAVVKYFEREADRREIDHYRLLGEMNIPTVKMLSFDGAHIVMEDIDYSDRWRLGAEEDMKKPSVLRALAKWYFALHEGGEGHDGLKNMWSENDELTEEAIEAIRERLPGAGDVCDFARRHLKELREKLAARENTITYNDFYYTNFLIRRDDSDAMMFDYNLMGRGYRYADFRNISSSVSEEAFEAFMEEYGRLYREKHGREFAENEAERRLDDFLSPLLGLAGALKRDEFPKWAEPMRKDAQNGRLLALGKEIFKHAD